MHHGIVGLHGSILLRNLYGNLRRFRFPIISPSYQALAGGGCIAFLKFSYTFYSFLFLYHWFILFNRFVLLCSAKRLPPTGLWSPPRLYLVVIPPHQALPGRDPPTRLYLMQVETCCINTRANSGWSLTRVGARKGIRPPERQYCDNDQNDGQSI